MSNKNKKRVLVVGGGYDYVKLMFNMGYRGATNLDEADFLLFTGGEDVSPELYDEKKLEGSFCNVRRDREEKIIFEEAVRLKKPMVGICRGGQFLNVMNGGKMWQDVNNHCGRHMIKEVRKDKPRTFMVTSTHHQMMIPAKDACLMAVGVDADGKPLCDMRAGYGTVVEGRSMKHPDIEVVWYPKTRSLCYQPHPEFPDAPIDCLLYFEELLDELIVYP